MIKHALYVFLAALIAATFLYEKSEALDQIVRPYSSVRSTGMGGVHLTTGLYDQNFFGNPARAAANPEWRVAMPDPLIESTFDTIGSIDDALGGSGFESLGATSGKNLHGRVQLVFPGVYIPDGKNSYAFAIITSAQFDTIVRQSNVVDPDTIVDVGPSFTYARKLLEDDALVVGATLHGAYRVSSTDNISIVEVLQGQNISITDKGNDGAHIDFDLGATYRLPWQVWEGNIELAFAVNNVLGGEYTNLGLDIITDLSGTVAPQPRTFGFGGALFKDSLWKFTNFILALEFTDLGNLNGSFFKSIHLGSEAQYGLMKVRLGFNQGYYTVGLGFDLTALDLDLSWYGEEVGRNAGSFEDRRIALRLGFKI